MIFKRKSRFLSAVPDQLPLTTHETIFGLITEIGIASQFYFLAFMNRKFQQEFIQRVVRDKLNPLRILEKVRKLCALLPEAEDPAPLR